MNQKKAIEHIKDGMANLAQPIPHGANLCFLAALAELEKQPDLAAENRELKETLIDMCRQFASWSDSIGGYTTGGLSALEGAFDILNWTDPQPTKDARCQAKGCKRQATCGIPTKDGYKHLCGKHWRDEQALKEKSDEPAQS